MAVPLTGTGGLFTILGKIGGVLNAQNTLRGSTLPPKIDGIAAEFAAANQSLVDRLYSTFASYQSAGGGSLFPYLASLARSTVITMVNDDVPQADGSLGNALAVLIGQMKTASQTVKAATVSASVTAASGNVGTPVLRVSLLTDAGHAAENAFVESIAASCAADAQVGGSATLYSEPIALQGLPAVADPLSYAWPAGSGASASLACIDPSASGASLVTNGDFETWTVSNIPDGWTIGTGVAGSTVLESTAVHYDGAACLSLVGNGTENTLLYQDLDNASVSAAGVDPSTQLAFNLWLKADVVPAAGALRVALVDGSGAVVNDAAGNPNSLTIDLTTATTSFAAYGGFFRTPAVLPSVLRLELKLTTAVSSGSTIFVDRLAVAEATPLYTQGPKVAAFSSVVAPIVGDSWTIAVTNDRAATTPGGFQLLFDRLFGMKALRLLLPSSASPTISDTLIA